MAPGGGELCLAEAHGLWRHLDHLVFPDELQSTLEEYQSASGGTTKLGALLKVQLNR